MSSERPNQTAVDYLTIVLSPALIMGLIGSLVLFLLEILYKENGPWRERLQWILFFYIFGIVLVARISMQGEISSRASLYGSVLAFLTYMGMQSFIEYPATVKSVSFLINLVLVVVVWWCSYRLTWDCTNVDEETDMSGEGLLQAAGLEEQEPKQKPTDEDEPLLLEEEPKPGIHGWWERYQRYREQKNKKRTLGVWVVYFSLAALPIFGLGQAMLPLANPERRRYTFWLMTVYVACGLGLLLTTCFLGLRRYLRQKRLQMPAAMTAAWLSMGGMLLVGLLIVGAILPRPHAEIGLAQMFDKASSSKRKASQMAVKGDSPGEGEGRPGQGGKNGKSGNQSGEKGQQDGGRDKDGKGQGKGEGKGGQGKNGKDQGGEQGNKGQGEQGNDKSQDNQREKGGGDPKRGDTRQANRGGNQAKSEQQTQESDQRSSASSANSTSQTSNALQQLLQRVAPALKWIVFAVVAVVVLVALLRGGLGYLANFTEWARKLLEAWKNFWANLFGNVKDQEASSEEEEEAEEQIERSLPFRAYRNPFDSGEAKRMSSRELVRYTFRAVEAWARERELGREENETAMEFLSRLGQEVPALEVEAKRLGYLHARAEYGRGGMPEVTEEQVQAFWSKLERVVETPLSA